MADMGYCPSGRLFEAAACGVPIVTDAWEGIDKFYSPDSEVLVCRSTDHVLQAFSLTQAELEKLAANARERTLADAGLALLNGDRATAHALIQQLPGDPDVMRFRQMLLELREEQRPVFRPRRLRPH